MVRVESAFGGEKRRVEERTHVVGDELVEGGERELRRDVVAAVVVQSAHFVVAHDGQLLRLVHVAHTQCSDGHLIYTREIINSNAFTFTCKRHHMMEVREGEMIGKTVEEWRQRRRAEGEGHRVRTRTGTGTNEVSAALSARQEKLLLGLATRHLHERAARAMQCNAMKALNV